MDEIANLPKYLPDDIQKERKKLIGSDQLFPADRSLAESVAEFEEKLSRHTLAGTNWNQSQAARRLKISEHTLRYHAKQGTEKSAAMWMSQRIGAIPARRIMPALRIRY